ncbi:hypothetical protein [Wenjunlia tyrosinilytica]|uniref:Uncharacterized protein n=1 Tax=Wenjunlia tyrosinilytica TaxID=1544741 RepID=A0A917ZYW2_9ACTN|nr:hypothetical protein [Wenjunlia tyrosinilytica]GGP00991.1 hypothetical protein GCM10012280_70980 [Wenjunlia tyrosinilytica]
MLNPIDHDAVIRDGRVAGTFPDEIHPGVAWWIASCFIVMSQTRALAVAHDGQPTTEDFHRRFCQGAINAKHYACQVADLGAADEPTLLRAMKQLGDVPGAWLATDDTGGQQVVAIRLYDAAGQPVDEETGLAKIRKMIADDHVPIPVNEGAKGSVTNRRDLAGVTP